jgi:type II secretion system protein G
MDDKDELPVALPVAPAEPHRPPKTCDLGIYSMVLGIAGFFCFSILTGIPAVILGHMALKRIKESGGRLGGGGLAIAGLVLGYLEVFIFFIIMIVSFLVILFVPLAMEEPSFVEEGELVPWDEEPRAATQQEIEEAYVQLENIVRALENYKLDMGAYPPEDQGLRALIENVKGVPHWRGPYLYGGLGDPWGFAIQYRRMGSRFELFSLGPDGRESDDDLRLE